MIIREEILLKTRHFYYLKKKNHPTVMMTTLSLSIEFYRIYAIVIVLLFRRDEQVHSFVFLATGIGDAGMNELASPGQNISILEPNIPVLTEPKATPFLVNGSHDEEGKSFWQPFLGQREMGTIIVHVCRLITGFARCRCVPRLDQLLDTVVAFRE